MKWLWFLIPAVMMAQAPIGPVYTSDTNSGGTVTSVGLAGTANQITVAGASPITTTGSWTLSFPAGGVALPGITTPGGIVYMGSSVLSQDASNLFWDGTNHRMGLCINSALTAALHIRCAGAASISSILLDGALFSGGSGTTTLPLFFIQPSGTTAATTFSTSGTYFGINASTGFAGNFMDLRTNGGASMLNITSAGAITAASTITSAANVVAGNTGLIAFAGGSRFKMAADGRMAIINALATGFTRLTLGPDASTSYIGLSVTAQANPILSIVDANGGNTASLAVPGGNLSGATIGTASNCSSAASPAVCAAAASGSVVIAAAATSVVVNTTAITANSQIHVTEDQSLGTKLSVTCNTGFLTAPPAISARTAGTSFTISILAALTVNPACFSYTIVN